MRSVCGAFVDGAAARQWPPEKKGGRYETGGGGATVAIEIVRVASERTCTAEAQRRALRLCDRFVVRLLTARLLGSGRLKRKAAATKPAVGALRLRLKSFG